MRKTMLFVIIALFTVNYAFAVDKSVAVMNFANYGGPGMKFLSKSVPEAVASALSDIKGVRIVERNQLGKVLDEISLGQTGLVNTRGVYRVGKLARADVLILGSVSGNPGRVVLTMKAVNVRNGRVLTGKVIQSPIATLFDKAALAARSMGAIISGQGIGKISVSSNPSSGKVYIDGVEVGDTPLVQYKVIPGEHNVKVVRDGYLDYESDFNVTRNSHERVYANLIEATMINKTEVGFAVYYLQSTYDDFKAAPMFSFIFAHTFGWFQPGFEFAFSQVKHNMELISPIGTPFEMERHYNNFFLYGFMNFKFFPRAQIISPYAGIMIGLIHYRDYRTNEAEENETELVYSSTLFSMGPKVGVIISPLSFLSIFIEVRFHYQPFQYVRTRYISQGIGSEMAAVGEREPVHFFSLGGGIKFLF